VPEGCCGRLTRRHGRQPFMTPLSARAPKPAEPANARRARPRPPAGAWLFSPPCGGRFPRFGSFGAGEAPAGRHRAGRVEHAARRRQRASHRERCGPPAMSTRLPPGR
jgi:hypothetical protein